MPNHYYDIDGRAIGWREYGNLSDNNDYRRVGWWTDGDATLSTVWLGLDHNFGRGPLAIFESMVFGGEHDQAVRRYATHEEAIEGHKQAIADLQLGLPPWGGDE